MQALLLRVAHPVPLVFLLPTFLSNHVRLERDVHLRAIVLNSIGGNFGAGGVLTTGPLDDILTGALLFLYPPLLALLEASCIVFLQDLCRHQRYFLQHFLALLLRPQVSHAETHLYICFASISKPQAPPANLRDGLMHEELLGYSLTALVFSLVSFLLPSPWLWGSHQSFLHLAVWHVYSVPRSFFIVNVSCDGAECFLFVNEIQSNSRPCSFFLPDTSQAPARLRPCAQRTALLGLNVGITNKRCANCSRTLRMRVVSFPLVNAVLVFMHHIKRSTSQLRILHFHTQSLHHVLSFQHSSANNTVFSHMFCHRLFFVTFFSSSLLVHLNLGILLSNLSSVKVIDYLCSLLSLHCSPCTLQCSDFQNTIFFHFFIYLALFVSWCACLIFIHQRLLFPNLVCYFVETLNFFNFSFCALLHLLA